MARFVEEILTRIPDGPAYQNRFLVDIFRSPKAGQSQQQDNPRKLMAMTATLPRFEFNIKPFVDNGFPARNVPQTFKYEPLELSFLLDANHYAKQYFESWAGDIFDFDKGTFNYYTEYTGQIDVHQVSYDDPTDTGITYTTSFFEAYPYNIGEIQYAMDAAGSYMIVPVSFAYRYFKGKPVARPA